jgi:hypothetical protein
MAETLPGRVQIKRRMPEHLFRLIKRIVADARTQSQGGSKVPETPKEEPGNEDMDAVNLGTLRKLLHAEG